jgi:hypothetical protein
MAVELKEPALRLMTFIENNRQPEIAERFIADLVSRPLGDIAADAYVAGPLKPLLEQQARNIETIRTKAKLEVLQRRAGQLRRVRLSPWNGTRTWPNV